MSARRPLRSSMTSVAIAGAATLATVFASAPAALADDASVEPTTEPTETPAPVDETPAVPTDQTPPPTQQAPSGASKAKPGVSAAEEAELPDVAPDFGYQKFRVGVKIADGSYVPNSASTVGSKLHIVISDSEGIVEEVDCTTEVPEPDPTSDVEEDPTSTFCIPDDLETLSGTVSRAAAEVGDDDDFRPEQYYELQPDETATITQTKAGTGLKRSTDIVTIAPCEAGSPDFPPIPELQEYCASGDFEATPFKTTKVLFLNEGIPKKTTDNSGVSDKDADEVDGVLPDTGGSNAGLLGYAALMLAGGGWLTARGRRRPGQHTLVV